MSLLRMDNVLIVVDDLEAATAFFVEIGMELEGEAAVEGLWVNRVVGLDDVRQNVAMLRTPDGHGRLELTKFHHPTAVSAEPKNAPVNTLGIRRIMFAVEDIDAVLARLRAHGAELVGELEQYEDGRGGGRPPREDAAALGFARRAGHARHEIRLRSRLLRGVHGAARWKEHEIVPDRG
jgi:catechol 2,3-dioxygenase-like lactoylglutathione lyase family enzyme